MNLAVDRVAFLSGDISGRNLPLRPPWSITEPAFRSTCNSCGNCLKSCPTRIISLGRGRMPTVSFDKGECLFCGECVDSCETGALNKALDPWPVKASINASKCLAFRRIECRSCEDNCETRAISFSIQIGEAGRPALSQETCTGCGACYSSCPAGAIEIINITNEDQL